MSVQKPAQRHALVGKNTDKISSSKHFANNRPIRKRSHQKATQGSATSPVQPHHQFGHIPVQAEMLATIKSKLDQQGITGESKAVSQADQNFGIPTKCRNQHSVETNTVSKPTQHIVRNRIVPDSETRQATQSLCVSMSHKCTTCSVLLHQYLTLGHCQRVRCLVHLSDCPDCMPVRFALQ